MCPNINIRMKAILVGSLFNYFFPLEKRDFVSQDCICNLGLTGAKFSSGVEYQKVLELLLFIF